MEGFSFCTPLPSPDQPSSCHPGIISLLGLWIANTGYRKTNHRWRAVHLVTPGSLVCDRCNKSARHSPWQATWSSWHHDWSQCLRWRLNVATVTQSHTNWASEPPVKFVVWDSVRENVARNDLKLYPRRPRLSPAWLTEPAPTKNKIMKAGRFVCFPKTLLASRITVFLPEPKYLRESGPARADWTAANQFWVEFLFNKFSFYPSLQSGCLLCVWRAAGRLVVASHSFTSLPL